MTARGGADVLAALRSARLRWHVALTASYTHAGRVPTLSEAVDLEVYGRRAGDERSLVLTPSERADVLAFLWSGRAAGKAYQ